MVSLPAPLSPLEHERHAGLFPGLLDHVRQPAHHVLEVVFVAEADDVLDVRQEQFARGARVGLDGEAGPKVIDVLGAAPRREDDPALVSPAFGVADPPGGQRFRPAGLSWA